MSMIVLPDAGPLGMITNPKSSPENEACKNWLASLAYNGIEVVIPEIADYEVRRELLRAGKDRGLGRLDALKSMLGYAPITTPVMLMAQTRSLTLGARIGAPTVREGLLLTTQHHTVEDLAPPTPTDPPPE